MPPTMPALAPRQTFVLPREPGRTCRIAIRGKYFDPSYKVVIRATECEWHEAPPSADYKLHKVTNPARPSDGYDEYLVLQVRCKSENPQHTGVTFGYCTLAIDYGATDPAEFPDLWAIYIDDIISDDLSITPVSPKTRSTTPSKNGTARKRSARVMQSKETTTQS